ncbi:unnamed protein product [Fusarium langsethiae]|nr:unnamed protein product [Fusarium langsethiae]
MTDDSWTSEPLVLNFDHLRRGDVGLVGGKNSSLGEMIGALSTDGIPVPPGFAITKFAYWHYVDANNIRGRITELIDEWQSGHNSLKETGYAIRKMILKGIWPADTTNSIVASYRELRAKAGEHELRVVARSSATAEDLPDASFSGQQDTYLHITGERELLRYSKRCYASLFTDRAISYRQMNNYSHTSAALSIGVQQMAHSDLAGAGVMFSTDTKSGFDKIVLINGA